MNEFQKDFSLIDPEEGDLESIIDLKLLQANAAGILIELDTRRSWQYNPLFYLKIAFIGLDHALTKPAAGSEEIREMWGVDEEENQTRVKITLENAEVLNPAFDVTPAKYITGFITEKGVLKPPYQRSIREAFVTEKRDKN